MAQSKDGELCKLLSNQGFDYTKYHTLRDSIDSGETTMKLLALCDKDDLNKFLDEHNVVNATQRKLFILTITSTDEWKQEHMCWFAFSSRAGYSGDNRRQSEVEAIHDTLEYAMVFCVFKPIKRDETRIIVIASRDCRTKFELIVKQDEIADLPHLIRVSMKNEIPFWWCSRLEYQAKYLDEMTIDELTNTFKLKHSYRVSIDPILLYPTNFDTQNSTAAVNKTALVTNNETQESKSNDKMTDNENSNNNNSNHNSSNDENIILGKIEMSVILHFAYSNVYGTTQINDLISQKVNKIIDKNNSLNLFDCEPKPKDASTCFANSSKFREKYVQFFQEQMHANKLYCILTGKQHVHVEKKAVEDSISSNKYNIDIKESKEKEFEVKVAQIVNLNGLSTRALLWLLNDTIWRRMFSQSNYLFVTGNDFRNVLPLSAALKQEYDVLYWSFYPKYNPLDLENNNSVGDENPDDYVYDIVVFKPDKKLAIQTFIQERNKIDFSVNPDAYDWQMNLQQYTKKFHTFPRALALHCFCGIKQWGGNLMTDYFAKQWHDYFKVCHFATQSV